MFEKIFGIFKKRKQSDVSQVIPGSEGEEDMFDLGDTGLGDELDADTISLETGMSSGGFGSTPGGETEPPLDFEEPVGVAEPTGTEEELGLGFDLEEEMETGAPMEQMPREEPVSPLPEVEPYTPPKRRGGRLAGVLLIVAVAVVGLALGFFGVKPMVSSVQGLLTSGPTPAEQLAQLEQENKAIESELAAYRAVGSINDILAVKNEIQRRSEIVGEIEAIETKIADRPLVEERLGRVEERLDETERQLIVQRGTLANVQKALKQIEARNNYLIASTQKNIDQIRETAAKAEELKSSLDPERVERAEKAVSLVPEIQEELRRTASETLSAL